MLVIPNHDRPRGRIIFGIFKRKTIANDHDVRRAVFTDDIVEYFHIAIGHHHHAGSGRHIGDNIAFWCEILCHVIDDDIAKNTDIMPAHLRQIGQVKHENAARIMGCNIVMYIGIKAVFNLNTGHIFNRR